MSMKEIVNANTKKANATRGSVYTIHKYIEHLPNKQTTTSMRTSMRMHIYKRSR